MYRVTPEKVHFWLEIETVPIDSSPVIHEKAVRDAWAVVEFSSQIQS